MVEQIGANILIPLLVFSILIVGAYVLSNNAFVDVLDRRKKAAQKK